MADIMIPAWTVGDRLAKARREAGVKQTEMAEFLGVSHASVSAWENDQTPIKLGMLRGYATRCDVPFEWLRYGDAWSPETGTITGRYPWNAQVTAPQVEGQLTLPDRLLYPVTRPASVRSFARAS